MPVAEPQPSSEAIDRAGRMLREASRVVALCGAGVSAESGVPTFRATNGLWYEYRVEDVATPRAFAADPKLVWEFYHARRRNLADVKPNPGHYALAEMEGCFEAFAVVTQNIDGLHRLAGSRNVMEVHGNLGQVRCSECEQVFDKAGVQLDPLPKCEACGGLLRPNVVWFEETLPPDVWQAACEAVDACDCMLVVGTSAVVYPVAGLVWQARQQGAGIIEINLETTEASRLADVTAVGKSGEVLPQLAECLDAIV